MSENKIKPVAWTSECQLSAVRIQGDGIMMAKGRGWKIGLYDQHAIDALNNQISELKTMLSIAEFQRKEMQAERDDYASAADFLELEMSKFQIAADEAKAERDAAVADAERYRWLRKHLVNWCPDGDTARLSWQSREVLDAEIDAARSEGK